MPQRRPSVLAVRLEPIVKFGSRGAGVGLASAARAQFDEGVGLLGPRRQDAARAVIFERTADQAHTIGQQRRGQSIAGQASHPSAIEREAEAPFAIDAAALRQSKRLRRRPHANPPGSAPAMASTPWTA